MSTDKNPRAKVAVVLSGGGSRGAFQAGALAALAKHKLIKNSICVYSGVSVGALNAAAAACLGPDRLREVWEGLTKEDVYQEYGKVRDLVRLWRHGGGRSSGPLRQLVTEVIEGRDLMSALPFTCGSVNIETGAYVEYHSTDDPGLAHAVDHLVASASIPGVVPPVVIDGDRHWDGGLRNPTPIGQAMRYEPDYIIVIGTEPYGSHPMKRLSGEKNGLELIRRAVSALVEEGFESDIREFELKNRIPSLYKKIPNKMIFPAQDLGSADDFTDYDRRFVYGFEAADDVVSRILRDIDILNNAKLKRGSE